MYMLKGSLNKPLETHKCRRRNTHMFIHLHVCHMLLSFINQCGLQKQLLFRSLITTLSFYGHETHPHITCLLTTAATHFQVTNVLSLICSFLHKTCFYIM